MMKNIIFFIVFVGQFFTGFLSEMQASMCLKKSPQIRSFQKKGRYNKETYYKHKKTYYKHIKRKTQKKNETSPLRIRHTHNIHKMCLKGNLEKAKNHLIKWPKDIKLRNPEEETPLHCAIKSNNLDLVRFLVTECNADINARNKNNITPMNNAIKLRSFDILLFLLKKGAIVNDLDHSLIDIISTLNVNSENIPKETLNNFRYNN